MGHEVAAVVAIRAPEGRYGQGYPFALHPAAPDGDLLFVRSGERLGELLRAYTPDVALCASFPSRIPGDALAAPRHGILNSHPALLPRYRGPNPIGWALRNGDAQIGLTLHQMTSEFDAGPIYAQGTIPVAGDKDLESALEGFNHTSRDGSSRRRSRGSKPAMPATRRTRPRRRTPASSSPSTSRSIGRAAPARSTTRRGRGRSRPRSTTSAARSRSWAASACGCRAPGSMATPAGCGSSAAIPPCGCSRRSRYPAVSSSSGFGAQPGVSGTGEAVGVGGRARLSSGTRTAHLGARIAPERTLDEPDALVAIPRLEQVLAVGGGVQPRAHDRPDRPERPRAPGDVLAAAPAAARVPAALCPVEGVAGRRPGGRSPGTA